jgi:ABC-type phosphate transport system substrate-binding protein
MKAIRRFLLLTALGLAGGVATEVAAEVVVVVDARSEIEQLSRSEVINIFLGRHRVLTGGIAANPVDQPTASGLRGEFYRKLVGKDLAAINAYWARLIFSGKTTPPLQATSAAEVLQIVGKPGGIGYIERSQLDSRLRVVLEFEH